MIYQNSTQHSDVILNVNTSKVQRPYAPTMTVLFNPKMLGGCSEFLVSLTDQHLKLAMTFVTKVTIQEHARQTCQSLRKSRSELAFFVMLLSIKCASAAALPDLTIPAVVTNLN